MASANFLVNYLSQSFHIPHAGWAWWGHVPINFGFTRLKVKVTRIMCKICKHASDHYLENHLSNSYFPLWLVLIETWDIDIELIRSRSEVSLLYKHVFPHYFQKCLSQSFHIFHRLIGPGEGLTPIDFVFFRSSVNLIWVAFLIHVNGFRSFS